MNEKRILVVDDEPSVTRGLKLNLETAGDYIVQTENSAVNVLAAARSFCPDLVPLDVMMPQMDGGDVAAQMREDPLLKDIPVVFLTALASSEDTSGQEGTSGPNPVLAKPVDLGQLVKCIEKHARK